MVSKVLGRLLITNELNQTKANGSASVAIFFDLKAPLAAALSCLLVSSLGRAAQTASGDQPSMSDLLGAWRVVSVEVADGPVQALRKNDPSDMGAVLDIMPDRLSWRPRKSHSSSDVCEGPRLSLSGTVTCAKGVFGYAGATMKKIGKRLLLEWYDGAILTLERERGGSE